MAGNILRRIMRIPIKSSIIKVHHGRVHMGIYRYSSSMVTRERKQWGKHNPYNNFDNWKKFSLAIVLGGAAYGLYSQKFEVSVYAKENVYTIGDIEQHCTDNQGIWVTYEGSVYDITEFVEGHPGGSIIRMAAGSSIDPFFKLFSKHKTDDVQLILDTMKIGKIAKEDEQKLIDKSESIVTTMGYNNESIPDPRLCIIGIRPFEAETPLELISTNFITPNELFYVRNHFAVPKIDINNYALSINLADQQVVKLSMEDIKSKYPKHEITAVLQCAGNRRSNMTDYKQLKGIRIGPGFISNAKWGGVLLKDILKLSGVIDNKNGSKHVQFEGMDRDITENRHYGISIPIDIALDDKIEVLLAYEMNGEELPLNHGYPLRVIVPGMSGARSVKWLDKIVVSEHESKAFWQAKDYRRPAFSLGNSSLDLSKAPCVYKMPVTSAICEPLAGITITKGSSNIDVKGYAFSGGGNAIVNVEVSIDGGETWNRVDNIEPDSSVLYKKWTWTLWNITLPIPDESKQNGQIEILCRATDSSHNVQPESVKGIWNPRGFVNNSWHKVTVNIN